MNHFHAQAEKWGTAAHFWMTCRDDRFVYARDSAYDCAVVAFHYAALVLLQRETLR